MLQTDAGLGHVDVVGRRSIGDVKLGNSHLLNARRSQGGKRTRGARTLATAEVALRTCKQRDSQLILLFHLVGPRGCGILTDSVNGNASSDPLLDVGDHAVGQLGIGGAVQVVVVDVQDRVWVSRAGSFEGDADEVLTKHVREDRAAQRTVLIKDLVAYVLEATYE